MNRFSEDFLEELRSVGDLVSLISEDTQLKNQGDRFMGLCPFPEHNEKTPSFSVSLSKQVYYCFGCQNSGNIFTYLQKQKGMSFVEAVEYLAGKHGIALPKKQNYGMVSSNQNYFQVNEKACQFFVKQLNQCSSNHAINKYLKKRAWSKEMIRFFQLGYAPKGNALLNIFKQPEEKKMALSLGLLQRSQNGSLYDNFRNRLIFPIFSVKKQILGFGARALDDSLPKYINSKESQIFHKRKSFYGLNESSRYLRSESLILVVEGYTDFITLWQAGFKNVVATLGTAFTASHAKLLKRYVNTVVLVFDGDEAGFNASEKSLPLLLKESLDVKFLALSKNQDPDDFIKTYGKEAFWKKTQKPKDFFFFILQKKYQEFKNQGRDKIHLIEEMAPILLSTQNKALQEIYKQRVLDLFGNDSQIIKKVLNERIKTENKQSLRINRITVNEKENIKTVLLDNSMESEKLLLALCLDSMDFLSCFIELNALSLLRTKEMINIFEEMIIQHRQNPKDFDKLIHFVMNKISESRLIFKNSYPIFNNTDKKKQKEIFLDCINFLEKKRQHSQAGELLAKTKMTDSDNIRHLEQIFHLTKQRLQKNNKLKNEEVDL